MHASHFVLAGFDPADKSALNERQLVQEFPKLLFHLQQKEKKTDFTAKQEAETAKL